MKLVLKITKFLLMLGLLGILVGITGVFAVYHYVKPSLPSVENLKDVQLQVPLRIYSRDGLLISEYGEKRRVPVTFDEVPQTLVQAFLAAEDDRFYEHPGVDYQGLIRAAVQLALTGEKKQGGSTITMQVARNFFLSRKKTYLRKINEIFLALKIDRELSKNDVLTLYMNKIFLGHRAYGVGAAAQVYYGKPLDQLNLAQLAMIAGLPKAPSSYNPITNPQRATVRRNYVLGRMLELGFITPEEEEQARTAPITAERHAANIELDAPYIAEMARAEIFERFGEESYTGGYAVYTTVDSTLQEQATAAVHLVCNDYDRRHGYRGPVSSLDANILEQPERMQQVIDDTPVYGNLAAGIVTVVGEKQAEVFLDEQRRITIPWEGLEWAREYISADRRGKSPKLASDVVRPADLVYVLQEQPEKDSEEIYWRLAQIPKVNSALVSLDPHDGAINSLVGGYDFFQTKFNRVTQARRQPGSGFKAFIYSAALEHGFTAASTINDAPVVFEDASLETAWRPENYSGKFFGLTRLRYALTKSRNLVSIRLLRSIGINNAINHITNFGFTEDELPKNLSLALGTANVTPLQMARGYSVLANGGFLIDPYLVERIEQNSNVIFQANPKFACDDCDTPVENEAGIETADVSVAEDSADKAVSDRQQIQTQPRWAPRVISSENRYIMYSMMQDVITSGTATRARVLNRRDLAGKTGTTNDQRDAWFNGYNQSIVATAWVGFDNNAELGAGEYGGRAALPGWIHFMRKALQKYPQDLEPEIPEGMVTIRIDPKSGKLAAIGQKDAIFEVFRADHVPEQRNQPDDFSHGLPGTGNEGSGEAVPPATELF